MQNFEFKLTPAYCLYNGVAVIEQKGSFIKFMTESDEDEVLRKRLGKAFMNHLSYATRQKGCPSEYKNLPVIEFETGSHEEVRRMISRLYYGNEEKAVEREEARTVSSEAAAVILLDSILDDARKNNVTDIHIEKKFIRFRKNGKLENYASVQKERNSELIMRIKLLSGMNVLEKRKSQDGHFVYGEINPLFVRVSVMGITGDDYDDAEESVVMRLLDTKRLPLQMERLGFSDRQLVAIDTVMEESNGLILVCGPTGSGKSTTAASMLVERVRKSKGTEKIISMEDPPEYIVPGITQIKIDGKKGNGFSNALESIFRQDPDVIMIGEIRDENSAKTALRAAMTGHLVIATLHTDCASSAAYRLKDLGCSSEILKAVLRGVIVQELQHKGDSVSLLADVCIPGNDIFEEASFSHITNVTELIAKTRKRLSAEAFIVTPEKTLPGKEKLG